MSRTRFLLTYTLLVALGFFGMWLVFRTRDPLGPGTVLGPLLVLAAIVGLLVAFRRELREPESEKRAEWERTKAKGRLHHVIGQAALGVLSWGLFLLTSLLVDVYWDEPREVVLRHLRGQAALSVLVAAIYVLCALAWWSYQERRDRAGT